MTALYPRIPYGEADIRRIRLRNLLELYRERGAFDQDVDEALGLMREWYNGYRFANNVETESTTASCATC